MSELRTQLSHVSRRVKIWWRSKTAYCHGHGKQLVKLRLGALILVVIAGGWGAQGADSIETNPMHIEAADPFLWLEDIHGVKAMNG